MAEEYKVIAATDIADLPDMAKAVSEAMAEGWTLQGGVTVSTSIFPDAERRVYCFAQAMTRKIEDVG